MYTTNPRKEHGQAIRWLAQYLKGTRDKGIIMKPMQSRDLEVFVDTQTLKEMREEGHYLL